MANEEEGVEGEEVEIVEGEEIGAEGEEIGAEGEENETEGESGGEEEGAESEAGSQTEGDDVGGQPAPQSRRDKRITALAKERDEEREKRIRAETLAEERNTRPVQAADPEKAQRLREEKLAQMTPEERMAFETKEQLNNMQQQVLLTQLQTKDAIDKAKYEGRAANDPVWKKHEAAVEQRLAQARRNNIDYPREAILALIVGEQALKSKPTASAKKAAASRVASTESKSVSGRSNPSLSRRSGGGKESLEELEARIGDMELTRDVQF